MPTEHLSKLVDRSADQELHRKSGAGNTDLGIYKQVRESGKVGETKGVEIEKRREKYEMPGSINV